MRLARGSSGELALRRAQGDLHADVTFNLHGTAGQSFGAFAVEGMKLILDGQANDFVGKGLSGGEIVIRPRGLAAKDSGQHVILGNVALYGATSGQAVCGGARGRAVCGAQLGRDGGRRRRWRSRLRVHDRRSGGRSRQGRDELRRGHDGRAGVGLRR